MSQRLTKKERWIAGGVVGLVFLVIIISIIRSSTNLLDAILLTVAASVFGVICWYIAYLIDKKGKL